MTNEIKLTLNIFKEVINYFFSHHHGGSKAVVTEVSDHIIFIVKSRENKYIHDIFLVA